jgi:hypothetical protein
MGDGKTLNKITNFTLQITSTHCALCFHVANVQLNGIAPFEGSFNDPIFSLLSSFLFIVILGLDPRI